MTDPSGKFFVRAVVPAPAAVRVVGAGAPHGGSREGRQEPGVACVSEIDFAAVSVARLEMPGMAPALLAEDCDTYANEQYRITRTHLLRALGRPFRLAVSSPGAGDGKTVTAIHLAAALALKDDERTLLIDADMRHASVHERLGLVASPGLAEVLRGEARLEAALIRLRTPETLFVLPAGTPTGNPTDLLDSPAWAELLSRCRSQFAHLIVDTPPAGVLVDCEVIAAHCDGVLMVVRPNRTNRNLCQAALERLREKVTGVLINEAEDWFLWRRSASDYYSYFRKQRDGTPRSTGDEA